MSELATLEFKIGLVSSQHVEILVKNIGALLEKPLMIEFKFCLELVTKEVKEAVHRACRMNVETKNTVNRVSLANVVNGPAGWSVWAMAERTESFAVIRLLNNVDQNNQKLQAPVALAQDAQFSLRIPLTPSTPANVEIPCIYRYPDIDGQRKEDKCKLQFRTAGALATARVTFRVNHESRTMIEAGKPVNLDWTIENGVAATLFGPLPGGNTKMSLGSDDETTPYKIKKGSITIIAVGSATYVLQAEVRGAPGKPNELVIKTVQIDINSVEQYAHLEVSPSLVLPNGLIHVKWAVWDTREVRLWAADNKLELKLTEQGPFQKYQGSGKWCVNAPQEKGIASAWLETLRDRQWLQARNRNFEVVGWKHSEPGFTGKPLGMAVTAPNLALLTTDGLWLAEVGFTDGYASNNPVFTQEEVNLKPKAWHAISAFDTGFVVLQQTQNDELELVTHTMKDKASDNLTDKVSDPLKVVLGKDVQSLVKKGEVKCDLAVFDNRVYIVVEGHAVGGRLRRAFSVSFKPHAQLRDEPCLEEFHGYRLYAFDNALYAIDRHTGRMFRLRYNAERQLELAEAQSAGLMIRRGLIVPVGRLLLVLGPSSCPEVAELEGSRSIDCSSSSQLAPTNKPGKQDLVYNPQQDKWVPCGHGLDIVAGSVAAFREDSKRLWVINPDRKAHTLAANEHLFAPEFETDFSSAALRPYVEKTRKYQVTVRNETGRKLVPMSEAYLKEGFKDFSASGPVQGVKMPQNLDNQAQASIEFICNEADTVTLRFLTERPEGVIQDYLLEVVFSGKGMNEITSVFKRLTLGERGDVSVAEIPGTRITHGNGPAISVPPPRPLIAGLRLNITNQTSYTLVLKCPTLKNSRPGWSPHQHAPNRLKINWDTPFFVIYADGAGELRFDVDFSLPPGIEVSSASERPKNLIRIVPTNQGLNPSWIRFRAPNECDCVINYKVQRQLGVVAVAGGQVTNNGNALYVLGASPTTTTRATVWQIDPVSLRTTGQSAAFSAKDLFSTPYGIGVLKEGVVAMFGDNTLHVMDHSLKSKWNDTMPRYTALTNMTAYNDDQHVFFIGMNKEGENNNVRYRYVLSARHINVNEKAHGVVVQCHLDSVEGFVKENRVPGAPTWVNRSTISPLAVLPGPGKFAICIEGGCIIGSRSGEKTVQRVKFGPECGREEAVVFDHNEPFLYCAHSTLNKDGLVISRLNLNNLQVEGTWVLPGAVVDEVKDTRSINTAALPYQHHRAVSMAVAGGAVYVAFGRHIYVMVQHIFLPIYDLEVELPCRLLDVRLAKPPGAAHLEYAGPGECWMIWALGATYSGDGTKVDRYNTQIYKISVKR